MRSETDLIPILMEFYRLLKEEGVDKWKWKPLSHVRLFATPWTLQSMEFSRPEYWSGEPFPTPGDLPNPEIEPRSPALQEDSLPAEPRGKPKNTGVGSLSLLQGIFQTQESNWCLLHLQVGSLPAELWEKTQCW